MVWSQLREREIQLLIARIEAEAEQLKATTEAEMTFM